MLILTLYGVLWLQDEPLPCCKAVAQIAVPPGEVFIYCVLDFLKKHWIPLGKKKCKIQLIQLMHEIDRQTFKFVCSTCFSDYWREWTSSFYEVLDSFMLEILVRTQWSGSRLRLTAAQVYLTQGPFADHRLPRLTQSPLQLLLSEYGMPRGVGERGAAPLSLAIAPWTHWWELHFGLMLSHQPPSELSQQMLGSHGWVTRANYLSTRNQE